jgi:cell shape-determining protein MreC
MDVSKVALILIVLLLLIIIMFALTGLDVNNPMPAVERIIAWAVELNRSLSRMLRDFLLSVRNSIRESFQ